MKQILTFFVLGIFLYSCSSSEDGIENNQNNDPTIFKMSYLGFNSENQANLFILNMIIIND